MKLDAFEKRMLASPDQQISLTDPDSRSIATEKLLHPQLRWPKPWREKHAQNGIAECFSLGETPPGSPLSVFTRPRPGADSVDFST